MSIAKRICFAFAFTLLSIAAQGQKEVYVDTGYASGPRTTGLFFRLPIGLGAQPPVAAISYSLRDSTVNVFTGIAWKVIGAANETIVSNPKASTAVLNLTIVSNDSTITDERLSGIDVALLNYAGQSYNSPYWRKGNVSDTDSQKHFSSQLTLTTPGAAFYTGQTVTIIAVKQ